ncbi:MAG: helix-turn-helix domain-containing protein [Chloroflexi bacterium]|nr:helix-turn-helix domain-containing protein [Chloroflexota bacterium]MCY3696277.1 helix-turn-helix domain-containing protein [Chloroflexota bacterium]MXX32891.1 PASTA domain-containing protein [Chloroflexota bacterium]MYD16832.1 PASTA domain-containing protein [Chloroflexota bacterium]
MMIRRGGDEPTGIGEELRQARIRRGRSIAQANQATRIARQYLEALESEDWSKMPAAPFARGFLSSYAQYLGLDDGPLLERFPLAPTSPGDGLHPSEETVESYQSLERSGSPRDEIRPTGVQLGPWLVAAFVVLVIIVGVVAVVSLRDDVQPIETSRDVPGIDNVSAELESATSVTPSSTDFDPLPDLTQLTSRQAVNHVKLLNVPYVLISVYDDSPAGTVLEQSPAAGVEPHEDAVVTLVVSRGPRPGSAGADATDAAGGGG